MHIFHKWSPKWVRADAYTSRQKRTCLVCGREKVKWPKGLI